VHALSQVRVTDVVAWMLHRFLGIINRTVAGRIINSPLISSQLPHTRGPNSY